MDLGCIDMGCIEKQNKEIFPDKINSPIGASMASSKGGKSITSVSNKFPSQSKKPPHCKTSPLNWFPRRKVDSFLKRKIKLLQEVDGMHSTLDETLGDSNPHYSKVLREKIAVREAAQKAMEARKAALVEESWCRILKAARIESKGEEAQLLKAAECASKAFEAATAIGVIMYDIPDCPQKQYKIETSSPKGGSITHTVKASFETAFEVDKQVAAAVKSAFLKLESCSAINKDDFKELLRKISEHPDTLENNQEMSELSSECDSDTGADLETGTQKNSSQDLKFEKDAELRQKKHRKRQGLERFNMENLVDMMLERLKGLQEEELASLATIVATCGLNAALAEAENISKPELGSTADNASTLDAGTTRDGHVKRKLPDSELPSLDKFLVKRLTRLEREVLEAKASRSCEQQPNKSQDGNLNARNDANSVHTESDLGSVLQKPSSKFEREIEEAKKNSRMSFDYVSKKSENGLVSDVVPDFGSMLVKRTSKLEKEIEEARRTNIGETNGKKPDRKRGVGHVKEVMEVPSLDKVLIKHMSRLEKEVQEAKTRNLLNSVEGNGVLGKENIDRNQMQNTPNGDGSDRKMEKIQGPSLRSDAQRRQRTQRENCSADCEGLDKILVKHVSRLEKEKLGFHAKAEVMTNVKRREEIRKELERSEGSLDQVLVKHKSRLEREKSEQQDSQIRHSAARREAREKEMQEAWGGLSLGNSVRPHQSRLERDKAAWLKAEEEERTKAMET